MDLCDACLRNCKNTENYIKETTKNCTIYRCEKYEKDKKKVYEQRTVEEKHIFM